MYGAPVDSIYKFTVHTQTRVCVCVNTKNIFKCHHLTERCSFYEKLGYTSHFLTLHYYLAMTKQTFSIVLLKNIYSILCVFYHPVILSPLLSLIYSSFCGTCFYQGSHHLWHGFIYFFLSWLVHQRNTSSPLCVVLFPWTSDSS